MLQAMHFYSEVKYHLILHLKNWCWCLTEKLAMKVNCSLTWSFQVATLRIGSQIQVNGYWLENLIELFIAIGCGSSSDN